MAADLVQDLHLDENFLTMRDPWSPKVTGDELEKIRAYLAYVYLVSTYVTMTSNSIMQLFLHLNAPLGISLYGKERQLYVPISPLGQVPPLTPFNTTPKLKVTTR
jgi:hypothetical protein